MTEVGAPKGAPNLFGMRCTENVHHAAILRRPDVSLETVRLSIDKLLPGAHLVLLAGSQDWMEASLEARRVGYELRDTLTVLTPQGGLQAMLFRKFRTEATTTGQVLSTGTGALNIEVCRVRHSDPADFEKHKAGVEALKAKGGSLGNSWKNTSDLSGANDVSMAGRWPTNLVMLHDEGCQQTGTTKMAAPVINRFKDGMKPFGEGAGHAYESKQTGDAEGNEDVALWSCIGGCPIGELDSQSGDCPSKRLASAPSLLETERRSSQHFNMKQGVIHGGSGGASRFFPQFKTDAEMVAWFTALILPPGGELLT